MRRFEPSCVICLLVQVGWAAACGGADASHLSSAGDGGGEDRSTFDAAVGLAAGKGGSLGGGSGGEPPSRQKRGGLFREEPT
jgi:hypothetical protein